MITDRDQEVIDFVNKFKVARTSTLAKLFYPSLKVAQVRLTEIYECKELKRERYHFTQEYLYYGNKKPEQLKHKLLLTDFYKQVLDLGCNVEVFENELKLGSIIPDGYVEFEYRGKAYINFVEVQISKEKVDVNKYLNFYNSGEYKEYLNVIPRLIVVTDQKVKKVDEFDIVVVDTKFKNIRGIVDED